MENTSDDHDKYLVESPDISLDELYEKYYSTIQEKLKNNKFDDKGVSILIWHLKNQEQQKENLNKEEYDFYPEIYYGFCEDCHQLQKLHWEEGCADGDCCMKLICIDQCMIYCSSGHNNYYYNNGFTSPFNCYKCQEIIKPHITWWGLSPEEHYRKYG